MNCLVGRRDYSRMRLLNNFAKAFLYYSKRIDSAELNYNDDKPLANLIEKIAVHPRFENVYGFEITEHLLCSYVQRPEVRSKDSYSNEDADELLNTLFQNLSLNIQDHWVLIPLRGAYLSKTIRFKEFAFITCNYDEQVDTLRLLSKTTHKRTKDLINYTKTRKSQGFFNHPLLAVRVRHQHEYAHYSARKIAFYTNSILQTIYWAKVFPSYKLPLRSNFFNEPVEHLMIFGKEDWQTRYMPFHFNPDCNINLDWLDIKSFQRMFDNLFECYLRNSPGDKLTVRFRSGIKFFKKAIESEERNDLFEGLGLSILHSTIAAETTLLENNDPKRARLSFLLPRLVKLPDATPQECSELINEIYTLRSDFVHDGAEVYRDFDDNFKPGITTKKHILFKRIIGGLLCTSPYFIKMMRKRSAADISMILHSWFMYLENHWTKGRSVNPLLWQEFRQRRQR